MRKRKRKNMNVQSINFQLKATRKAAESAVKMAHKARREQGLYALEAHRERFRLDRAIEEHRAQLDIHLDIMQDLREANENLSREVGWMRVLLAVNYALVLSICIGVLVVSGGVF